MPQIESIKNRFIHPSNAEERIELYRSLTSYEKVPLVSLEKACQPLLTLVEDLPAHIVVAKTNSRTPANNLSQDESAAIHLYTLEWTPWDKSLYAILNKMLRSPNRSYSTLEPWLMYLKLFVNALNKLPADSSTNQQQIVYRGLKVDTSALYVPGSFITWWAFTSCTQSLSLLESNKFLGSIGERTIFNIETANGKNISAHSHYGDEKEILLLPGSYMKVVSRVKVAPELNIIHLREEKPPLFALEFSDSDNFNVNCLIEKSKSEIPFYKSHYFFIGIGCIITIAILTIILAAVLSTRVDQRTTSKILLSIPLNAKWTQQGVIIAGGNGRGNASNQLYYPCGIYVDIDQTIYVADRGNNRVVKWTRGALTGQIVAGINEKGQYNQLNEITDVYVDKVTNNLIICDWGNRRVVQWSLSYYTQAAEVLVFNIDCYGVTMDDQRFLYVTDLKKQEVIRFKMGDINGTLIGGGNQSGDPINQLGYPSNVFVDQDYSVYVADSNTSRVIKWPKNVTAGVIVAGGNGKGGNLTQLSFPFGVHVDQLGTVYVSDSWNLRVVRWPKGATRGTVIIDGSFNTTATSKWAQPRSLSFDIYGNCYIVDWGNDRVLRYDIITS